MIARYDYAAAHPFALGDLPDSNRKIVVVRSGGEHAPFSPANVARYVALYGETALSRWAYAEPCDCEGCAWRPPAVAP